MSKLVTYISSEHFNFQNTPVSFLRPGFDYQLKSPKTNPLISIITPFYNTGEIFHETAQSVLRQSLQQFEWIIVNDGSDDPISLSVLDNYRHADPRIRVLDLPVNSGLPAARNFGVKEAKSPFVLFLDSDDLLEPTAAEKWYWLLKTNPDYSFVKGYTVGFGAFNYLWVRGFFQRKQFLRENLVDVTSLVRKEVVESVEGFDETLKTGFEDWEFWLKCANSGYWGATIPEYMNWYRRKENATSRWQAFNSPASFLKMVQKRYPRLFQKRKYFQSLPIKKAIEYKSEEPENVLSKSKPRLLMIVPFLTYGGAEKFELDLAHQLKKQGWEVTIATTLISEDPWRFEFEKITPDIFMLHRFLRIKDYPAFLGYLIESRNPDVVFVTNSEIGFGLLPFLRSCYPAPLYISYAHMEEPYWIDGGYPRLAINYQDFLDLSIVTSHYLRNWIIERGGHPQKHTVCYINIDTDVWKPDPEVRKKIRESLGVDDDLPIILFTGRLVDQKQPLVFVKVIRKLREKGIKFLSIMIGDGPDRQKIEHFIKTNNLQDTIRLLGALPSDQTREYYQASDIFFLPSKWEGIALSIYEAMACGLFVVGADVGGQSELVTSETGILHKPTGDINQDIDAYTNILEQSIKNPYMHQKMGANARQRVAQFFHLEAMIKNMLQLFEHAREQRNKRGQESLLTCDDAKEIATEVTRKYSTLTQTSFELLNESEWNPPSFGIRLYFWLRSKFYGIYLYGKRRNWKWWIGLKNWLLKILTQDSVEEL